MNRYIHRQGPQQGWEDWVVCDISSDVPDIVKNAVALLDAADMEEGSNGIMFVKLDGVGFKQIIPGIEGVHYYPDIFAFCGPKRISRNV